MKKTIFYIIFILFSFSLALAHEEDMVDAKKIIESGVSCDELTEEQLEHLGDYIMEQMHPGESHKIMDRMMGGEDSELLRQAHINMAYRFYCNNIKGGGMMANLGYGMMGYGMMGGYGGYGILSFVVEILVIIVLVLLVVWLYKKITEKRK